MTFSKRIALIWSLTVIVLLLTFALPHWEVTTAGFLSYSIQVLLFILSIYLVKYESSRKTKFIFVNFTMFFGISFLFHIYYFIGTVLFVENVMARHYYFQYVSNGLYFFLLTFSICYIMIDLLFRDFKTLQKYALAFTLVGGFFLYYYYPYFEDPDYLYKTREISEWKEVDKASGAYTDEYGTVAGEQQLTEFMNEGNLHTLPHLSNAQRAERVSELYPFLAGSNYLILMFKPIHLNAIYLCVLSVGAILLFFGYQYKKDPPQGAYIEKMMFFFLIFCTLEIFHAWSFIKTIEWQLFSAYVGIGQYLSTVLLLMIAGVFSLRLRFITSAKGMFYEHEIAESPNAVTRWRDAIDNLVISHFFNRNRLHGRLFVDPKLKNE